MGFCSKRWYRYCSETRLIFIYASPQQTIYTPISYADARHNACACVCVCRDCKFYCLSVIGIYMRCRWLNFCNNWQFDIAMLVSHNFKHIHIHTHAECAVRLQDSHQSDCVRQSNDFTALWNKEAHNNWRSIRLDQVRRHERYWYQANHHWQTKDFAFFVRGKRRETSILMQQIVEAHLHFGMTRMTFLPQC